MKEKTKKPFYKRWWFIAICAFLAFGVIGTIFESEESKQERAAEEVAAEQKRIDDRNAKKEAKKLAAEEEKRKEAAEKEEYEKLPFYERLKKENEYIDDATFSDGKLTISKEIKTYFSDTHTMKDDVYEIFEVMEKGFKDESVNEVEAILSTTLHNEQGKEYVDDIVKYRYSRDNFKELDISNFKFYSYSETWRIMNQADHYWIRPGIYNNIDPEYRSKLRNSATK
ncbi:hypothetical protein [Sporosarcina sp. FSL K6-3508]|uniref:hypothetical protein n=1 Tax=Sporosarcina sp. FSL K6-3508 TaxID=2921557 RepID=UPI003159C791